MNGEFKEKLLKAYNQLPEKVGHPLNEDTIVGPMIDSNSVNEYLKAIEEVKKEGGKVIYGGEAVEDKNGAGAYVIPAIAEVKKLEYNIVQGRDLCPAALSYQIQRL
ncbi:MAG: aldehyde dehydrogenase family protein [Bacteroidales bacterium]|nr:aldehyde dehydrogenase family protein [Bacteroidales bacterium]